ncbi:TnsA-like heteromeric transposase endonuclease subunit [Promicromonospora sukumoe]|uniref:TnsA endonuclease-like protein n=1 Tax=Promicromonospora sukumoe TaxID=88382 RepID=A0A7W3PDR4_9MICO|nr:TnsA-like heteromeric transposase endonuclease subunit [Promicromonospora sukumoe]MBA8808063.1 hypothetical protein [Promicromonospora sukumoe]
MLTSGSSALAPQRRLGISLSFRTADGTRVTEDLADAWSRPFERLPPARNLVQYKGQRNFTGSWWCATTAEHVGFESWVERDHVMLLDHAATVVGIGSQPFGIDLETDDGTRSHVPDYFVREIDGSVSVIDVRPDELVGDDAAVFSATADACELVGWKYRRVGRPDPVLIENVRWLAGYRHPRCARQELCSQVKDMNLARNPARLVEVAQALGDPVVTLPTVFHLLWRHDLTTDIHGARLSMNSLVRAEK